MGEGEGEEKREGRESGGYNTVCTLHVEYSRVNAQVKWTWDPLPTCRDFSHWAPTTLLVELYMYNTCTCIIHVHVSSFALFHSRYSIIIIPFPIFHSHYSILDIRFIYPHVPYSHSYFQQMLSAIIRWCYE